MRFVCNLPRIIRLFDFGRNYAKNYASIIRQGLVRGKVSMGFLPADALICRHFYSYEAVRSYYRTVVLNPGCLAFVTGFGYSFQIPTVTSYTHRILAGALAATRGRVNCSLTFHFLRAHDKRGFAGRVNRLLVLARVHNGGLCTLGISKSR